VYFCARGDGQFQEDLWNCATQEQFWNQTVGSALTGLALGTPDEIRDITIDHIKTNPLSVLTTHSIPQQIGSRKKVVVVVVVVVVAVIHSCVVTIILNSMQRISLFGTEPSWVLRMLALPRTVGLSRRADCSLHLPVYERKIFR
jgi:hypothetical protein